MNFKVDLTVYLLVFSNYLYQPMKRGSCTMILWKCNEMLRWIVLFIPKLLEDAGISKLRGGHIQGMKLKV